MFYAETKYEETNGCRPCFHPSVVYNIPSRNYAMFNEEELTNAVKNMTADVELKICTCSLNKSGSRIGHIEEITRHCDRYN